MIFDASALSVVVRSLFLSNFCSTEMVLSSASQPVCWSTCSSVCLYACMYVCMYVSLSICLSVCRSVSLSVYLSVRLVSANQ